MLHDLIVELYGQRTYDVLIIVLKFYPLWLPPILAYLFWELWVRYVRYYTFITTKMVLLEIMIPRDLAKSPMAMEIVLNSLYQIGGEGTVVDRYWTGRTRAWFSLELASFGGEVHFYLWTRENQRNMVEAHFYSQYPSIEIREVEDYAKNIVFDPEVRDLWAIQYKKTQPNPIPIKTYEEFGLLDNPKPEHEVDPIANMLEVLGSMNKEEDMWLQIVVRGHKKEKFFNHFWSRPKDWTTEILEVRKKLFEKMVAERGGTRPAGEEDALLKAIDRSVQKFAFDVGIRAIYFAPKGKITLDGKNGMRGFFRPYGGGYPDFKPGSYNIHFSRFNTLHFYDSTDWDYPWQDFMNIRVNYRKWKMLDAYKRRMFFYTPYEYWHRVSILTTEELATIYHLPTAAVVTPGLPRIESKRAQAPSNLPV
jgi:hypothetical protein